MTTVRSFSFVLAFFALLLCTLFPVAQIGWSINIAYGSGDTGSGEACEFSDAMETTDSEDESFQEALGDCVVSRMSVSDCESSRTHALINEIPPLTLLVSRLLHPPTAKG